MSHLALPSHSVLEAAGRPRCAFIIDPRTSQRLGIWDTLTAVSLIVTAVLTPYEAAFLSPGIVWLFWLNRLSTQHKSEPSPPPLICAAEAEALVSAIDYAQLHGSGHVSIRQTFVLSSLT